jgi:transposase InsO family protein
MTPFPDTVQNRRTSVVVSIEVADGTLVPVEGEGEVTLNTRNGPLTLTALIVPDLHQPLLSVPQFLDEEGRVLFHSSQEARLLKEETSFVAERSGHGFEISDCGKELRSGGDRIRGRKGKGGAKGVRGDAPNAARGSAMVWHQRLGHVGWQTLQRLFKDKMSGSELHPSETDMQCDACLQGKMTKTPFPTSQSRSVAPLQLVHADLMGPIEVRSFHGNHRYILVIVDDYSRYVWTYTLRTKSEAIERIVEWTAMAERQLDAKLKVFRSDRGGEFINSELLSHFTDIGVVMELTCPGTPEQNGVAERMNRTLCDRARSMLFGCGLPPSFWSYAVSYTTWVTNRLPSSANLDGKSPHEVLKGERPDLALAKVFGCMAHVWVSSDQRRGKLSSHSEWGIFLGIPEGSKGWMFYMPLSGTLHHVSRNAQFRESLFLRQWRKQMKDGPLDFPDSAVISEWNHASDPFEVEDSPVDTDVPERG